MAPLLGLSQVLRWPQVGVLEAVPPRNTTAAVSRPRPVTCSSCWGVQGPRRASWWRGKEQPDGGSNHLAITFEVSGPRCTPGVGVSTPSTHHPSTHHPSVQKVPKEVFDLKIWASGNTEGLGGSPPCCHPWGFGIPTRPLGGGLLLGGGKRHKASKIKHLLRGFKKCPK